MARRLLIFLLVFALVCTGACAEAQLSWRFADAAEGAQLLLSNHAYYEGFTANDLTYRLQKPGGTINEWKEMAAASMRDFSPEERMCVDRAFSLIQVILGAGGLQLPPLDEIILIKTTAAEECSADAYTHGTQIYLSEELLEIGCSGWSGLLYFTQVLAHELFHCLSRANPGFRAEAYGLIGFRLQQDDFPLDADLQAKRISNPDVERRNYSAQFTINGKTEECFTVYISREPWSQPGDSMFERAATVLVPVERPGEFYFIEQVPDFWDVFGLNTGYVLDPEECLAENFAMALMHAGGFIPIEAFPDPQIIEGMLALLAA